jgi:hypothetical protein
MCTMFSMPLPLCQMDRFNRSTLQCPSLYVKERRVQEVSEVSVWACREPLVVPQMCMGVLHPALFRV